MTTQNNKPDLFVVDGSNIATEGRSKPSLEQLNEAVEAFKQEYPGVNVTVVVDATFGHRIAKKEVKAFDAAVANNELVTPPAGAVGRGDAFILAIANKAGAGVFSNDSFQEFHGDYEWLFDNGRLIGAKPVPHVGWVFVDRNPVRGPRSRESIRAKKNAAAVDESPTEAKERALRRVRKKRAAEPSTESSAPSEPSETSTPEPPASEAAAAAPAEVQAAAVEAAAAPSSGAGGSAKHVNDLVSFLEFVERHAIGQTISATVASYSSHGAYAEAGDVQVYIPLRLMSSPPPTSARKMVTIGDTVDLVIASYSPERRSIDAALPAMAPASSPPDEPLEPEAKKAAAKKAAAKKGAAKKGAAKKGAGKKPAAKKGAAKKSAAKKSAAEGAAEPSAVTKPAAAGPASDPQARKKPAAKKGAAKKPAAKKAAPKKRAGKKPAAKKGAAKQPAAKHSAGERAAGGSAS